MDSKGLPTIGVGYLINGKDWQSDFRKAGVNLSDKQMQDFKTLLKNLSSTTDKEQKKRYVNAYNAKSDAIKLSSQQEQNLFNNIIGNYKNEVRKKLGDEVYNNLDKSDEMISLVSLAYNNPALIGQKLVKAIKDGNRAEAWYEIRYNSNAGRNHGLQNRRTFESDNFGLYHAGMNKNEAKKIIDFLVSKDSEINRYLKKLPEKFKNDLYEYKELRMVAGAIDLKYLAYPQEQFKNAIFKCKNDISMDLSIFDNDLCNKMN